MFQKVLVAEDYESASISVQKSLTDLNIADAGFVYYCDEALALLRKSLDQNKPFDLLITDLSFEEDFAKQDVKSGNELIIAARKLLPTLRVLVFSGEKRPLVLKELFEDLEIDGFVSKGRMDVKNLKTAITTIKTKSIFPQKTCTSCGKQIPLSFLWWSFQSSSCFRKAFFKKI